MQLISPSKHAGMPGWQADGLASWRAGRHGGADGRRGALKPSSGPCPGWVYAIRAHHVTARGGVSWHARPSLTAEEDGGEQYLHFDFP